MFYHCPKCKKIWQYPIEKCPDCFLVLERMKSLKIRVIGISKVTIPTMFHPKVPYFVLLLEDEKGNKWVQKSVKEYKIGDQFNQKELKEILAEEKVKEGLESSEAKEAVAIWRIKYDILEGIEKTVELIGGIDLNSDSKILILPTLTSPRHPYFAENTSPQFLESLIKYLKEKGGKLENIIVANQSFDEIPIETSAQKSQLLKVCQDYKITPLDLTKTNFSKKSQGNFTFEISEAVFKSDLIINLPILKMGKISATENVLKFLKKENYLSLKYLYSEEDSGPFTTLPDSKLSLPIIENLNKVLPQYLTIGEAQLVQKPDKFVAHLGLILSSFNCLNLDRVFAEITMTKELPEFLKKVKIEDIPIIGRKLEELQYEVEKY